MEAGQYEIVVRQGDTFRFSVTYRPGGQPADLTGYTAELVISWPAWSALRADAAPVAAGEVLPTMAALDATGVIVATMTVEQTASIPVSGLRRQGPAVTYQLRIRIDDDPVTTLLSGPVDVRPDVFELVS